MGFTNLEMFNRALLGKHGWRFITNPDSLCARVLKTKYYPDTDFDTDFMQATVPARASATWRAIASGKEALSCGLIKRIGDGTSVSIWTDQWVPGMRTI
jgi:hypothetical protein